MVYETVSGDTFDLVALKTIGDENAAKEIIKSNIGYAHVVIFESGIQLTIPEITKNMNTTPNLPPWKSGDN